MALSRPLVRTLSAPALADQLEMAGLWGMPAHRGASPLEVSKASGGSHAPSAAPAEPLPPSRPR